MWAKCNKTTRQLGKDLDALWAGIHSGKGNKIGSLSEKADRRLRDALRAAWAKCIDEAEKGQWVEENLTLGGLLPRFVRENEKLMEEFFRFHKSYEGDIELFIHEEWSLSLEDDFYQMRRHQYVETEWHRQHEGLLKKYGMAEESPATQLRRDNEYIWRRVREDCFNDGSAFSLERLSLAFDVLAFASVESGSFPLLKFAE